MSNDNLQRDYLDHLFQNIPLYTTRLVREGCFTFCERVGVTCPEDLAPILMEYFKDKDREEFIVCLLDTAGTLIGISIASVGGLAACLVEPRQVLKLALLANAMSVICAHNHPSGNPEPSKDDVRITRQLVAAGQVMNITVADHLIITPDGYTSLCQRGYI
jgi:DNA repair protein RadC